MKGLFFMPTYTLADLAVNESGTVVALESPDNMRRRLLDIGLTKNTTVTCVGQSPAGDPVAFNIRGSIIALRRSDCKTVIILRGDTHGAD